jgi:hypothetical protein
MMVTIFGDRANFSRSAAKTKAGSREKLSLIRFVSTLGTTRFTPEDEYHATPLITYCFPSAQGLSLSGRTSP